MRRKRKTSGVKKTLKYTALAGAGAFAAATAFFFKGAVCRKAKGKGFFMFQASDEPEAYKHEIAEGKEWLKEMEPTSEYWMIRSHDGLLLEARFLPAEKETNKTVLAVHGYLSDGERDYAVIARFFHEAGYNVLLLDNRAHGASEGKYIGFGCLEREDCYRWIQYLNRKYEGNCEIFLHGISLGAAAVLMTSELNLPPSVKGMVADCPYTSPAEVFETIAKERKIPGILRKLLLIGVDIACRMFAGYGLGDCSAEEAVTRTKLPLLLIHGDQDRLIPSWMSKKIYDACVSKKELWIVKGADHAEAFYYDPAEYERRVKAFFEACEK